MGNFQGRSLLQVWEPSTKLWTCHAPYDTLQSLLKIFSTKCIYTSAKVFSLKISLICSNSIAMACVGMINNFFGKDPWLFCCWYFFKAALKKNLSPGYVKEDLVQLGLSEEKASWVAAQVEQGFTVCRGWGRGSTEISKHCDQLTLSLGYPNTRIEAKYCNIPHLKNQQLIIPKT